MSEIIIRILVVVVIASVLTTGLIGIDYYTRPIIQKNAVMKEKMMVLDALGIPYQMVEIDADFENNVDTEEREGKKFYISKNGEIAFVVKGAGLWSTIEAVIALEPDYETIKGFAILNQAETPGLGDRIKEKEFLDRFDGKRIKGNLEIVPPGKAKNENQIDGITGATMTSKALEKIINTNYNRYLSLLKGE